MSKSRRPRIVPSPKGKAKLSRLVQGNGAYDPSHQAALRRAATAKPSAAKHPSKKAAFRDQDH